MNLFEINSAYEDGSLALMNEGALHAAQNLVDTAIDRIRKVSDPEADLNTLEAISSFITAALDTKYGPITTDGHAN